MQAVIFIRFGKKSEYLGEIFPKRMKTLGGYGAR